MKFAILSGLIFTFCFHSFKTEAQRRVVTKKEIHTRKVVKRSQTVRRHHRAAHFHYRHLPKWGYRVKVAPEGASVIVFKGVKYRFLNGMFYKPVSSRSFVVVAAPRGIKVTVLPKASKKIVLAGKARPYYYYYGTYYAKNVVHGITNYEAVEAPIGAQVDALPEGYKELEINENVYYVLDNDYYKEVVTGSGDEVHYEVVNLTKSS